MSKCIIIETDHCFIGYIVDNIYICASGVSVDDVIDNLIHMMMLWDEQDAEMELMDILKKNNINGSHELN